MAEGYETRGSLLRFDGGVSQARDLRIGSQIRRAAVSIASNIAEGHSRTSRQAYLNHLSIALGSQSEVETQIELASRLSMMPNEAAQEVLTLAGQVGRMLHALIASLERN